MGLNFPPLFFFSVTDGKNAQPHIIISTNDVSTYSTKHFRSTPLPTHPPWNIREHATTVFACDRYINYNYITTCPYIYMYIYIDRHWRRWYLQQCSSRPRPPPAEVSILFCRKWLPVRTAGCRRCPGRPATPARLRRCTPSRTKRTWAERALSSLRVPFAGYEYVFGQPRIVTCTTM